MNKKNIILVAFVAIVMAAVLTPFWAGAALDTTVFGTSTVVIDATTNSVKAEAYPTATLITAVASTTAVAITAMTGRDYLEIRAGPGTAQEIWVGIATDPTTTTGICVTSASPFRVKLTDAVVVKTIASGAFQMAVFQAKY